MPQDASRRWSIKTTSDVRTWLRTLRQEDPDVFRLVSEFHDWDDLRAELHDGDDEALAAERARTEAWISAYHLAEERKRLGMTQRQVAELMGVSPGRVSQIENGDLEANEVATLSRYARALGARMRIIFDYGNDLRQIA
ncbi:helix-turn-helix domain-containing protein [Actinoplanes sp. NPDC049668]|uniref:transcriptional regulator n=1 Tax=unclassified Actinoplanes TaxID=2626549 RepID=UPI0033A29C9D